MSHPMQQRNPRDPEYGHAQRHVAHMAQSTNAATVHTKYVYHACGDHRSSPAPIMPGAMAQILWELHKEDRLASQFGFRKCSQSVIKSILGNGNRP